MNTKSSSEYKLKDITEVFKISKERQNYVRLVTELIDFRQEQGLTQEKLGNLTGLTQPQIAKIETFALKPKFETIVKIASALNVEITLNEVS